jgi:hypothetical protein
MNILCIICKTPEKRWCVFLNKFNNYKIYIIVDDNNFDLSKLEYDYKNINFIKIDDEKCKSNGYVNAEFKSDKIVNAWDKALFYFGVENKNYEFIWFLEDDVFFHEENTLIQIDNQYSNEDLLSNLYYPNTDNTHTNLWKWDDINIDYNEPYYSGSMNSVRVSNEMIECINYYATKNDTLFYIEALFPTIAIKNNLKYITPTELSNVKQIKNYERKDINKKNLYHPENELNIHIYYRTHLIPHLIIQ